jgi:hypothetical protein
MNWSSELLLRSKKLHRQCCRTLGGKTKVLLGHLMCHERRAYLSCLAFCSIHYIGNKTFWVTFSYSMSSFILLFPIWKLQAMETPAII